MDKFEIRSGTTRFVNLRHPDPSDATVEAQDLANEMRRITHVVLLDARGRTVKTVVTLSPERNAHP